MQIYIGEKKSAPPVFCHLSTSLADADDIEYILRFYTGYIHSNINGSPEDKMHEVLASFKYDDGLKHLVTGAVYHKKHQ